MHHIRIADEMLADSGSGEWWEGLGGSSAVVFRSSSTDCGCRGSWWQDFDTVDPVTDFVKPPCERKDAASADGR